MKTIRIVLAFIFAVLATPATAATINFTYSGRDVTPPFTVGGFGTLVVTTSGSGSFTAPDQPIVMLSDLSAFSFVQTLHLEFSNGAVPGLFPANGVFTYGLADLQDFSAGFSGSSLASVAFNTSYVPGASDTFVGFNPERLSVAGLAPDQVTTYAQLPDGSGFPVILGQIQVLAAVPEATTWMMLILGFGMMGIVLRGRGIQRRPEGVQATKVK
jgi:PEP-CTERM motif